MMTMYTKMKKAFSVSTLEGSSSIPKWSGIHKELKNMKRLDGYWI
jgi:hypothetical protein